MNETPDQWTSGDAYEHFMGRWSRLIAKEFIQWLNPPASWTWLEVGCGTGALTQAICLNAHPASVVACDPSPQFVSYARHSLSHQAASFMVAGIDALPHTEGGYDAVVSGLVLNFIPTPDEAVRAMTGRLRPGGIFAAYVWDYADGMQLLRIFWETAVELNPEAAELGESERFLICRPEALVGLLEGAGLGSVEVRALEIEMKFPDFDSLWAPFRRGTGPAPSYVASLHPTARERLRQQLQQRLIRSTDSPVQLSARAWAVRGRLGTDPVKADQ